MSFSKPKFAPVLVLALLLAFGISACVPTGPPGGPGVELEPTTTLNIGSKKGSKGNVKIKDTAGEWFVEAFGIEGPFAIIDKLGCLSKVKKYKPTESCIIEIEHTTEGTGDAGSFGLRNTLGGEDGVAFKT